MARPREFDLRNAREDAMNVFWSGGYEETRLPDLLDGLKLSRGSLYKAFGSKRQLYIEALNLYDQLELQPGIQLLRSTQIQSGQDRIVRFFESGIARVESGDQRGCLLCNAAVDVAHKDAEIGQLVGRMLSDLTDGFAKALLSTETYRNAPVSRRIARANGIRQLYVGLRVLARSGVDASELRTGTAAMIESL